MASDRGQDGLELLEVAGPVAQGKRFLAGGDAGLRGGQIGQGDEKFRQRELPALERDGEEGPEFQRGGGRLVALPPVIAPRLLVETVGEMAVRGRKQPADGVRVEIAALQEERMHLGEPAEPVLLGAFEGAADFLRDERDEGFAGGGRGGMKRFLGR